MAADLPLPDEADLPDLPVLLGPLAATRPRLAMPWHLRLFETLSAYLPLLLMAMLALASWWLVKNSPRPAAPAEQRPASTDPDYTMTQFALERFDAGGRLKLRIEGERMRHFPATDRIEIDAAQIRSIAADGRLTLASAQRAVGQGDGSELQLLGGAQVTSEDVAGAELVMRSEYLQAFLLTERIYTHLPVWVQRGATHLQAGGLDYDHAARRLDLKGPVRAVLAPRATAGRR